MQLLKYTKEYSILSKLKDKYVKKLNYTAIMISDLREEPLFYGIQTKIPKSYEYNKYLKLCRLDAKEHAVGVLQYDDYPNAKPSDIKILKDLLMVATPDQYEKESKDLMKLWNDMIGELRAKYRREMGRE